MNRLRLRSTRPLGIQFSLVAIAVFFCDAAWAAKNVILMIADGSGYNSWLAASLYQGKLGKQTYDQSGWIRLSCCTYPLNLSRQPTGDLAQDQALVYDPLKAWDSTPKRAKAAPRSRGGKESAMMDCDMGCRPPPPALQRK